jgi:phage tail-like protein
MMVGTTGSSMVTNAAAKVVSANRFVVQIDGMPSAISFTELSNISSEVEPAEYYSTSQAMGVNLMKTYGKIKPATVTLKRGVDTDHSLWIWHNRVIVGDPSARSNCSLILENTARQAIATYNLINAWPNKLQVQGLKAGGSEVLIAECTLVCDQILIPGVTTAAGPK